jgi:RNA polymerase sigma-70 factor, ECF subfamily
VTRAPAYPTLDPDPFAPDVCYPEAVRNVIVSLPPTALDHLDALYRVARRLTGRDDEAEDLVQETYARAIAAAAQFQPDSDLRPWLFRILRNAHIDAYRRAQKNPVRGGLEDDLAADTAATEHEPIRGDADLERIRGSVTADIEAALASLSEQARTIILLDLEGFSESEVAAVLGCALGTVKSRLSRARAILRDRLRDYEA